MYRILIADDEKVGRDGIKFLLKQLNIDCQIKEVQNGKLALDYIQNNPVDILLTDIKMPFMDGLELIEKVEGLQDLEIIIFSGYSDFEYAKTAMSHGVNEYILKPVDPEEFSKVIHKVVAAFEERKQQKSSHEKSKEIIKEHILFSLINGHSIETIEKNDTQFLQDIFYKDYKRLMLLDFTESFFDKIEDFQKDIENRNSISFDYLNLNSMQSLLLIKEDDVEKLKSFAENIVQYVDVIYNRKCYIALSSTIHDINDLKRCNDEVEDLIENRYFNDDQRIFTADKHIDEEIESKEVLNELVKNVRHAIKVKDIDTINDCFHRFYSLYSQQSTYSNDYIKFIFSGMLRDVSKVLTDFDEKQLDREIVKFYHAPDFKSMMEVLNTFLKKLEEEFAKNDNLTHKEIDTVIKYIYDHYDEDLSVDGLADLVCLAPSYLSHIFKKETGQNLGKFIKKIRMEKAKEMLEETHEKIVTVSMAVGYQNVSYFCQSFREYYGISPQKYRNQGD